MGKRIREACYGWWVVAASFLIALAAIGAGAAAARAAVARSEGPPAVDYTIHVRLDPGPMRLHGSETLRYTNRSPDAIPDLRFHLYLNGFRNEKSTFMRESRGHLRRVEMPSGGW